MMQTIGTNGKEYWIGTGTRRIPIGRKQYFQFRIYPELVEEFVKTYEAACRGLAEPLQALQAQHAAAELFLTVEV